MSRFKIHGHFCILPAVGLALAAALVADGRAESPCETQSAGLPNLARVAAVFFDFLDHLGRAAQRSTDTPFSMVVRVVDTAGKPIVGAKVMPEAAGRDTEPSYWTDFLPNPALTAWDGTTRVILPSGKWSDLRIGVDAEAFVPLMAKWTKVEGGGPIPTEFTFKLARGRPVGGVIRDESGRPIAGACLAFSMNVVEETAIPQTHIDNHEERTDAQGRWRCSHLPENTAGIRIRLTHEGHAAPEIQWPKAPRLWADLHEGLEAARLWVDLRAEKAVFTMYNGLIVQGKVTDAQGHPPVQAMVVATDLESHTGAGISTDKEGRYRIVGRLPRKHAIHVEARGLAPATREVMVRPDLPSVDFCLAPGRTINLRVVDQAGKPLASAFVERDGLPSGDDPWIGVIPFSDQEGRWSCSVGPGESAKLMIFKGGYAIARQSFVPRDDEYLVQLAPAIRNVPK
jgi:hypothetical protein